jgi:hypothetical protein
MMMRKWLLGVFVFIVCFSFLHSQVFCIVYSKATTQGKIALIGKNGALFRAEEKKITDKYYELDLYMSASLEAGEAGIFLVGSYKIWKKGNMERTDMTVMGWPYPITTLKIGEKEYNYDAFGGEVEAGRSPATFEGASSKAVQDKQNAQKNAVKKQKMTEKEMQALAKAAQEIMKHMDVKYLGTEKIGDRLCYVLKTVYKDDPTQYNQTWIDSKTSHAVKIVTCMNDPEHGKKFTMSSVDSGFYVHSAHVIYPGLTKIFWNGKLAGKAVYKKYKINGGMSGDIFSRNELSKKYNDIRNQMIADAASAVAEEMKNQAVEGAKEEAKNQIMNMFKF